MKYDIVIPICERVIEILNLNLPYIITNIDSEKIVIVGNNKLKDRIDYCSKIISFLDEDSVLEEITYDSVKSLIYIKNTYATKRTGWYLQQFLKLGYARITDNSYYLTWDADTIPLNRIEMFSEDGRPYFDLKDEYHIPYFSLLNRLLGIKKVVDDSFISEHMMFKTQYVLELIEEIENKSVYGNNFAESIINSIYDFDLEESGFSEFEAYGNFVATKYKNEYLYRKLKTLRKGDSYLGNYPQKEMLTWAAESFDTISFENRGDGRLISDWQNILKQHKLQDLVIREKV